MSQGNLSGRKILIPEDDYLQAMTIAETLAEHGAEVVGPFSAPEKSLLYCQRDLIDAAVLDIKIGEADSFPIALETIRRAGRAHRCRVCNRTSTAGWRPQPR